MTLFSGLSDATSTTGTAGTSQSATDKAKLNKDLNQFLNLLVTQLKNQDPLNPMDANQFTSQLVQFASVEQEIYTNSHLEDLVNLQQTGQVASMVDYLNTTIEASGKTLNLENGGAKFTYTLDKNAYKTTITITDGNGDVVASMDGDTGVGYHAVEWDGKDLNGNQLDDGTYKATVTALDGQGNPVDVSQTVFARVTGAGAESGNVVLYAGDVAIPMSSILSVNETPASNSGS